jgi:hypothetical protein
MTTRFYATFSVVMSVFLCMFALMYHQPEFFDPQFTVKTLFDVFDLLENTTQNTHPTQDSAEDGLNSGHFLGFAYIN